MPEEPAAYHRLLPLTAAQLQQICRASVFRHAQRYSESSHMVDRFRIGPSLSARFHGTRGIYSARLSVSGREVHCECTCPLASSREPCKHAIAVGLAWLRAPDTFHDLDVTLARLTHLNKGDLITLIRQAATRLPELIPLLERRRAK